MLDPAHPRPLDLTDFDSYIRSCLDLAQERLGQCPDVATVARQEDQLNRYPRMENLEDPRDIWVLDQKSVSSHDLSRAGESLLQGRVLLEHTCAGEATRLGLGTKYLINPPLDLTPEVLANLLGPDYSLAASPDSLRPMSLGRRHMLQLAWDLTRLAEETGQDPDQVLAAQHLLIIVNQASADRVLEDFQEARFYGFDQAKVLFMIQKAFHGITGQPGSWIYDPATPSRLHNHGQMLMQTTMDSQLFCLEVTGRPSPISWSEYLELLAELDDKISFNIEDLDYLRQSLDLTGLAAALKLGAQGARMVMEVVANNPDNPQKGGACAWDPELKRNVMIESFQLAGLPNAEIAFLNKNVNHYPQPRRAALAAHDQGLSMPLVVKKGAIYFQPVQGDLNFLLQTAFVRRARLKPIRAWKSAQNTPAALEAMADQEKRAGFITWAEGVTGLRL